MVARRRARCVPVIILHVIPSVSPSQGGPSLVLPIMERALCAQGLRIETATTNDDGPGRVHATAVCGPCKQNGVIRHYFPKQTEFYKVSLPLGRWLQTNIEKFDILHVHALFSYSSVAAMRVARSSGVPYVIRPLGVLNKYGMTQRRALLKRLSLRWVEGSLLRNAAAVHFTHETERDEALAWGLPMHPVVIPLGLEPNELPSAEPDRSPTILYLSRLDPKKNVESLLEAWADLHRTHPSWSLVIAGDGAPEYVAGLQARAAGLGIGQSVRWAGHVDGSTKAQLLANAEVFVLPSFSENFGIAAAEALLAGKACVFSHGVAVGTTAAARDAAILSKPSPTALAQALHGLMSDPESRGLLGSRAREFAERELSAASMGRRLRELYEQILSRRRP